jgi:hypothetical protein
MTNTELAKELGCSKRQVSKAISRAKSVVGLLRRGSALYVDNQGHWLLDGRKEIPVAVIEYMRWKKLLRMQGTMKYVAA